MAGSHREVPHLALHFIENKAQLLIRKSMNKLLLFNSICWVEVPSVIMEVCQCTTYRIIPRMGWAASSIPDRRGSSLTEEFSGWLHTFINPVSDAVFIFLLGVIMNKHLNYFRTYRNDQEDQLTRGLILLLRMCPPVWLAFYDYLREKYSQHSQNVQDHPLPPVHAADFSQVSFDIQTSSLETVPTSYILSVLITDEHLKLAHPIKGSERRARYDGVIRIGDDMLMILENKPSHKNVWEGQLSPSVIRCKGDEYKILKEAVVLQWKEVIGLLNNVKERGGALSTEFGMIDDFLTLIDDKYPELNPYPKFALCKNNPLLVEKHLENILEEIVDNIGKRTGNTYSVSRHSGWQSMVINLDASAREWGVRMIGFPTDFKDPKMWNMTISIQFGVSQSQSQLFFSRKCDYQVSFEELEGRGWKVSPLIYLGFMQHNPIKVEAIAARPVQFAEHWRRERDHIHQRKIRDSNDLSLITELADSGLLTDRGGTEQLFRQIFLRSKMRTVNLSPTICLERTYTRQDLCNLEDNENITDVLRKDINIVFSTISKGHVGF